MALKSKPIIYLKALTTSQTKFLKHNWNVYLRVEKLPIIYFKMELNQYTIFIFIMGLAVGSIITSLLYLFFFKRTMRKLNQLNRDNNYLTNIVKGKFKGRIIGKNF